jgi:hyperosmotically inducible protein
MDQRICVLFSFLQLFFCATTHATNIKAIEQKFNDLVITTNLTDAYITARVEAAVLKAKVLDDESIPLVGVNAKTIHGTVTLTGGVKKSSSIIAILKRVNAIHGVKKIVSDLIVSKET